MLHLAYFSAERPIAGIGQIELNQMFDLLLAGHGEPLAGQQIMNPKLDLCDLPLEKTLKLSVELRRTTKKQLSNSNSNLLLALTTLNLPQCGIYTHQ